MISKLDLIRKFLDKRPEILKEVSPTMDKLLSSYKSFEESSFKLPEVLDANFSKILNSNKEFVNFDSERYGSIKNTSVFLVNHVYLFINRKYASAVTLLYALYDDDLTNLNIKFLLEAVDNMIKFGPLVENLSGLVNKICEITYKSFEIIRLQSLKYENANWQSIYELKLFIDRLSLMLIGEIYSNEVPVSVPKVDNQDMDENNKKEVKTDFQYEWGLFLSDIRKKYDDCIIESTKGI